MALHGLMPRDRLGMTIVHGGAKGADTMAQDFALSHGTTFDIFKADWNEHGRAAGPLRNQAMVDSGADYFLAFQYNGSSGTADCIRRAYAAGIPGKVYSLTTETYL